MSDAAGIIQALIARMPSRVPPERSTGMPHGWAHWMKAGARPEPVRVREMLAVLAQRPPAVPPRAPELAGWRAVLALFRQDWAPPPRDERPIRWTSGAASLLLHLLFVFALLWIAWIQSRLPVPPADGGGGGGRVEIGFVGRGDPGTPQAGQGASPATPAPAADGAPPAPAPTDTDTDTAAQAPAPDAPVAPALEVPDAAAVASEVAPSVHAPEVPLLVRDVPEPVTAPPAEVQPVQVTEVERPTIDFVLPPTTPPAPQPASMPERQLQQREVTVVEAPRVQLPAPRAVQVPSPRLPDPQLRQRAVDEPLPPVEAPRVAVQAPQVEARLPEAAEATVRQHDLPLPAPARTATSPGTSGTGQTAASAADAPVPSGSPAATAAADEPAPGASASPGTQASGPASRSGWERALAGDDWGQAASGERRPGQASGLFDGEGRIRLPGEGDGAGPGTGPGAGSGPAAQDGVAERGPPGSQDDTWTRDRIARSGTWLKRPPYDYEPTRFDQYWLPNESLLAEWVRKGVRSVSIPIPGTNGKTINCVVSLLQLGGGCGLGDPNLNEQPAVARPPPDIPFKPELQEDNGSVAP